MMIDEEATFLEYGCLSTDSRCRRVIAVCDDCGAPRDLSKYEASPLCLKCVGKGRQFTAEAKHNLKLAWKTRPPMTGDTKKKMASSHKKMWQDPEYHKKQSASIKKYRQSPESRRKTSLASKKHWKDPAALERMSAAQKKLWEDPEHREKMISAQNHEKLSAAQKKLWEDPEYSERMSRIHKKRYEDPKEHEKQSAAMQGISYDDWEGFAKDQRYCPKFNEKCRESNREKYDRRCFLTDLPEAENITATGRQQKLSVHHVDMNKQQGCNGNRWRLVPLALGLHGKTHNPMWVARIQYLLEKVWNTVPKPLYSIPTTMNGGKQ